MRGPANEAGGKGPWPGKRKRRTVGVRVRQDKYTTRGKGRKRTSRKKNRGKSRITRTREQV